MTTIIHLPLHCTALPLHFSWRRCSCWCWEVKKSIHLLDHFIKLQLCRRLLPSTVVQKNVAIVCWGMSPSIRWLVLVGHFEFPPADVAYSCCWVHPIIIIISKSIVRSIVLLHSMSLCLSVYLSACMLAIIIISTAVHSAFVQNIIEMALQCTLDWEMKGKEGMDGSTGCCWKECNNSRNFISHSIASAHSDDDAAASDRNGSGWWMLSERTEPATDREERQSVG